MRLCVCRALGLCGWSETPPPSLADSGSEVSPSEGPRGPAPHVPGDTRRAAQGRRYEARRRHSRCRCYLELPPAQAPSEVRGVGDSRAERRRADCGGLRRRKTVAPPPRGRRPALRRGRNLESAGASPGPASQPPPPSGRVPARAAGAQTPSERWPRAADAGEAQGEGGGARCRGPASSVAVLCQGAGAWKKEGRCQERAVGWTQRAAGQVWAPSGHGSCWQPLCVGRVRLCPCPTGAAVGLQEGAQSPKPKKGMDTSLHGLFPCPLCVARGHGQHFL